MGLIEEVMPYRDVDVAKVTETAVHSEPEHEVEVPQRQSARGSIWSGMNGARGAGVWAR